MRIATEQLATFAKNVNAGHENDNEAKREKYPQRRRSFLKLMDSRNVTNDHQLTSYLRSSPAVVSRRRRLQSDRMTRFEPPGVASVQVPARPYIATVTQVGSVEPKTGNHCPDVTMPGINCEPTATTVLAVAQKIGRRNRRIQQPGVMKGEGNRAGTIISIITKGSVSPAPDVRPATNCVHGPNRVFDAVRRVRWRVGDSISQHCAVSMNHRMRIR